MLPVFDTYVMVDWSASNEPSGNAPGSAAIWWAVQRAPFWKSWQRRTDAEPQMPNLAVQSRLESGVFYEKTRGHAFRHISDFLRNETRLGMRVLIGFDFAFGYPKDFLRHLHDEGTLDGPSAVTFWEWISKRMTDDERTNVNNRFDVAGELNRAVLAVSESEGPFWGYPSDAHQDIPKTNPYAAERKEWPFAFSERRQTERIVTGATPSTLWQLYGGPNVVGSQALLGLHWLHHFHRDLDGAVVWPFHTGLVYPASAASDSSPQIVIAEIYPSLLKKYYEAEPGVTDSAQVSVNARAFAHLDQHDSTLFRSLFQGHRDLTEADRKSVTEEEGWILGAGFEKEIDDALRSWSRSEP